MRVRCFSIPKSMLEALIQMLKIHTAAWEFGSEINKFRHVLPEPTATLVQNYGVVMQVLAQDVCCVHTTTLPPKQSLVAAIISMHKTSKMPY
jgi:hypothetical protein